MIQFSAKYWEITGNLNAIWFSAAFRNYLLDARVRLRRTGIQKFCVSEMFLNAALNKIAFKTLRIIEIKALTCINNI